MLNNSFEYNAENATTIQDPQLPSQNKTLKDVNFGMVPLGMFNRIDNPQYRTSRELSLMYQPYQRNLGFVGKLGTSLKYATVTGEAIRDLATFDTFRNDPNFMVSDDLLTNYASDLPEETQERLKSSGSLMEFLHETDDARLGLKRMEELFKGGALDKVGGFLALMGSQIPEYMAIMYGLGAAGLFATASASTIAQAPAAALRSQRLIAINNALKVTGAEIPFEILRYNLDKTLTPNDVVLALGMSAGIGSLGSAIKPKWFDPAYGKMLRQVEAEEKAELLRAARREKAADYEAGPKLRAVSDDEILTELDGLSRKELRAEAKRLGIKRNKKQTDDELRFEIAVKRREETPGVEAFSKQTERNLSKLDGKQLIILARKLNISIGLDPKPMVLRRLISEKLIKDFNQGHTVVKEGFKITGAENKLISRSKKMKQILGIDIEFDGDIDKALWSILTTKSLKSKKALIDRLKKEGIEDPEKVSAELQEAAINGINKAKKSKKTSYKINASKLIKLSKGRKKTKPLKPTFIDTDILNPKVSKRSKDVDPHPIANARNERIDHADGTVDVNPEIPFKKSDGLIDLDPKDIGAEATANAGLIPRTAHGHGKGFRETVARYIEGASALPIPVLGKWLHTLTTPLATRLLSSESLLIREFTSAFMESPRGSGYNAQTVVRQNTQRVTAELRSGLMAADIQAQKLGYRLDLKDPRANRRIIRALTREDKSGLDAAEQLAVEAIQNFHTKLLNHAKKYGLLADEIPDAATYFHRVYKPTTFAKKIETFGKAKVIEFFATAIRKANLTTGGEAAKIADKKALEAAKRIVSFGEDPEAHRGYKQTKKFLENAKDDLTEKAKDLGFTKDDISDILDLVTDHVSEPHLGMAKRRILLDENYEAEIDGVMVHIDEFFNRDIQSITGQYAHKVLGAVEVRKSLRAVFGEGKENMSFDDVFSRLQKAARQAGEDEEYVTEAAKMALRSLSGIPLWDVDPKNLRMIIGIQSFAQSTIGQYLGLAQLPEIANVMMRSSLTSSIQAFPSMGELAETFLMGIRKEKGLRGVDGRLNDKVAAELETFIGAGTEYHAGEHFLRRIDDMASDPELPATGTWGAISRYNELGREVSMLNPLGIMPMDTFLRRWAAKAHFQNFVNKAYSIKNGKGVVEDTWWRRSRTRFQELGLRDEEIERVIKALTDPDVVKVRAGHLGDYKVIDIDFTKVKDQDAYDRLALAIRRGVDNSVQRQSLGELPLWMTTGFGPVQGPVMKLLMQYRTFMMGSKAKQLAAGVARGDVAEAVNVVGSAGLGYLSYMLLTYGRSLAVDPYEREAWLAERLSTEEAIKSAIMRSSYSTVFPMLLDTASTMTHGKPLFSPSMRTTGLGINPIEGSVVWSLLKNAEFMLKEMGGAATGNDPFSKKDARDLMRLAWFTRIPAVSQAADYLVSSSDLPATDRRR